MNYLLKIECDHDAECPMDMDGQWKLVSFVERSIHYGDISEFFDEEEDGTKTLCAEYANLFKEGFAYWLDYYEHGQSMYSIHRNSQQCRWDTSWFAGILYWEHPQDDMGAKTPEDRQKDAEAFLNTYNDWCNGNVYGYIVEDSEFNEIDSCWGFYEDYITEAALEAMTFEPGDCVKIVGDASYVFDETKLPPGVELVEDFE